MSINFNESKMNKKNNLYKISGFNGIIVVIISFLYILLITKFAEIICNQYQQEDSESKEQLGVYVMIIYFVSIIGIIAGYIWFNYNSQNFNTQNWIIRWSLSIGGVIMLIYTIINYWEYLGDYCKLLLIFLSITCIIYYLYKYY